MTNYYINILSVGLSVRLQMYKNRNADFLAAIQDNGLNLFVKIQPISKHLFYFIIFIYIIFYPSVCQLGYERLKCKFLKMWWKDSWFFCWFMIFFLLFSFLFYFPYIILLISKVSLVMNVVILVFFLQIYAIWPAEKSASQIIALNQFNLQSNLTVP